jgi:hypothetical protein
MGQGPGRKINILNLACRFAGHVRDKNYSSITAVV